MFVYHSLLDFCISSLFSLQCSYLHRSSSTAALTAFAVATAGSVTYPGDPQPPQGQQQQVSTTTQQPSVTMPVSTQPQTQAPPPQPQTTPRTSRAFLQPTTGQYSLPPQSVHRELLQL